MLALGIDIGSSSVKVAVYDQELGRVVGSGQFPEQEMAILAKAPGWAEQAPLDWWEAFLAAFRMATKGIDSQRIECIGIAYQMHGLVCLDSAGAPLRPSIIWCDSRAVGIGNAALEHLGADYAFRHLLNSPGNFTASKLFWVKSKEPELYKQIAKICLPGDYLAMKLTGHLSTTFSGLSEGIFYDFEQKGLSQPLLEYFGFDPNLFPEIKNCFDRHGQVSGEMARELNISTRAIVSYKAGDQPNNALSLNVLQPGEMAATAGTSGVVYGVSNALFIDYSQRINSFAHVNYQHSKPSIGVLLCINGVGIANAWLRKTTRADSYQQINAWAAEAAPGSLGLQFFPFGNGAERMLGNANPGASLSGLQFNSHNHTHLARAVQEGIAYSFLYGVKSFEENQLGIKAIRAGRANMFLSPVFSSIIATLFDVPVELYDTDGATGAARGALVGAGHCTLEEAFQSLQQTQVIDPNHQQSNEYRSYFSAWKSSLENILTR
jgi:xylulokinase